MMDGFPILFPECFTLQESSLPNQIDTYDNTKGASKWRLPFPRVPECWALEPHRYRHEQHGSCCYDPKAIEWSEEPVISHIHIYIYTYIYIHIYIHTYIYIYIIILLYYVYIYIWYVYIYMDGWMDVCLFVCLFVYLVFIDLFIYLCVCLYTCIVYIYRKNISLTLGCSCSIWKNSAAMILKSWLFNPSSGLSECWALLKK